MRRKRRRTMEENQPLSHFRRPSPGPEKQPVPLVDYVLNAMKFVDAILSNNSTDTTAGSLSHRKASCRSWAFSACPTCPSTSQPSQPAKRAIAMSLGENVFLKSVTYWPTRKFRGAPV